MKTMQKYNIIRAALKGRFLQRQKEQRTDLALAIYYGYSTTQGIHAIMASVQPLPNWTNYDAVRQMLDTDVKHFNNDGIAGAQGNHWSLTEEGQALLDASFEHQLLEAQ